MDGRVRLIRNTIWDINSAHPSKMLLVMVLKIEIIVQAVL